MDDTLDLKALIDTPGARGVVNVPKVDLRVDPDARWAFADANRAAINAHWEKRLASNPSFFNGAVMMLLAARMEAGVLHGSFVRTDFKSFLFWKDEGYPEQTVRDAFGSGLIWSSDGALMLIRQAPGQVNSGLTYLPGGFIDARDVDADGRIDIVGSVVRELKEETGLLSRDMTRLPGMTLTVFGAQLSFGVGFVSPLDAPALQQRVMAFIEKDENPELSEVILLKKAILDDGGSFAPFAQVLTEHVLSR